MRTCLRLRRRADLLLGTLDLLSACLACYVAYVLRFGGESLPEHYSRRYAWASIGVAVAWVVAGRVAGLYRRAALRPGDSMVEPSVQAALAVGLVLLVVDMAALGSDLSRGWIALVTFGLIFAGILSRGLVRRSRRMLVPLGIGLERYALVGDDAGSRRLLADLTRAAGAPFRVVEVFPAGVGPEDLAQRAKDLHLDGLILPPDAERAYAGRLAAAVSGSGVDVLLAPGVGDLDMRVASLAMLHGVPLLRAAGTSPRRRGIRTVARRDLSRGVAILGTRGVPANYGGFETFAERLALHLVDAGVPVTVYCRRHHMTESSPWRGINLVALPTIRNKYFDTVIHTLLSTVHLVLRTRIRDVVLCNAANAPALPVLRLAGRRVVMNVDGLEWRRGKWGVLGRSWYRMGEWLSVRFASVLVTDADEVRTYYRVRHDTDSVMVPYGADVLSRALPLPTLDDSPPLRRDGYALYVSRWERENNPLLVAEAHAASGVGLPLVMLGKATYDDALDEQVRAAASTHAVLPGPVYGRGYRGLQAGARCYVHATEVGGTHPALIEAMGAGNLCLVLDTPENREVAGEVAWLFADAAELAAQFQAVDALDPSELARLQARSRGYAARRYSWPAVCGRYLELLGGRTEVSSTASSAAEGAPIQHR